MPYVLPPLFDFHAHRPGVCWRNVLRLIAFVALAVLIAVGLAHLTGCAKDPTSSPSAPAPHVDRAGIVRGLDLAAMSLDLAADVAASKPDPAACGAASGIGSAVRFARATFLSIDTWATTAQGFGTFPGPTFDLSGCYPGGGPAPAVPPAEAEDKVGRAAALLGVVATAADVLVPQGQTAKACRERAVGMTILAWLPTTAPAVVDALVSGGAVVRLPDLALDVRACGP